MKDKTIDGLKRLEALSSYQLDLTDTGKFHHVVELGRSLTDASVCLIHILDGYIQWPLAQSGKYVRPMPVEESVCQYTIREDKPMEIQDLSLDDRFRLRDYVAGDEGFRFYYGIPLKTEDDIIIGTLCVLDRERMTLTTLQKEEFTLLARILVDMIIKEGEVARLQSTISRNKDHYRRLNHDVRSPVNGILATVEMMRQDVKEENLGEDLDLIHRCGEMIVEKIDRVVELEEKEEYKEQENEELVLLTSKLEDLYLPLAQQKGIHLQFETGEIGHIQVREEYLTLLIQIAGNLISNAIKFTGKRGNVHVRIDKVVSDQANRVLEMVVGDNGVGMDAN